jgi:hypothetical protein
MTSNFTNHSALAALVAGLALSSALILAPTTSQAGYSGNPLVTLGPGTWKIDVAKSHFGPERNTIVLERAGSAAAGTNGTTNTFVVISNGRVYLATSSEAFDQITNGAKKIDYAGWKDMKLVQVGEDAKATDTCGFRCQSGGPEDHLTISFKSVNGGMPEKGNIVVLNKR